MNSRIFLTGGTGFLGSEVLRIILETTQKNLCLLIRAENNEAAQTRLNKLIFRLFGSEGNKSNYLRRIKVLAGDIESSRFGLSDIDFQSAFSDIEDIYHCAAITSFDVDLGLAIKINVGGTKNLLESAKSFPNLRKISYVSTVFVAGDFRGNFSEKDYDLGQNFNNNYERSKFEAENVFRSFELSGCVKFIFRPSIIFGRFKDGATSRFNMLYEPLHIFSREILDAVPANPRTLLNLIPVDAAAESIFLITSKLNSGGTYHIVSPTHTLSGDFMEQAAKFFGFTCPEFIPWEEFDFLGFSIVQKRLLSGFLPYLNYKAIFLNHRTVEDLRKLAFLFPDIGSEYYRRVFEYLDRVNYIKKKNVDGVG